MIIGKIARASARGALAAALAATLTLGMVPNASSAATSDQGIRGGGQCL